MLPVKMHSGFDPIPQWPDTWKGVYPIHYIQFYRPCRHSHGGTGFRSTHKPFFASRVSFSNPSSTVSPGAYFRYHQVVVEDF
jgi:hypothetical protein